MGGARRCPPSSDSGATILITEAGAQPSPASLRQPGELPRHPQDRTHRQAARLQGHPGSGWGHTACRERGPDAASAGRALRRACAATQITVFRGQQGLDRLLSHLLRQEAGLGGLTRLLQQSCRPQIIPGLANPQPGPMARALQAHGKRLPASSGIASDRTDRQNGASPWRARSCGAATSGCSGSLQSRSASSTAS